MDTPKTIPHFRTPSSLKLNKHLKINSVNLVTFRLIMNWNKPSIYICGCNFTNVSQIKICAWKNICLNNIFNNQICKIKISFKHVVQIHLLMHMTQTTQYRFPAIKIQTWHVNLLWSYVGTSLYSKTIYYIHKGCHILRQSCH
jgi:hypothetical protein